MRKPSVIILGKLPPPYMGPAIATQIIMQSTLNQEFDLHLLNTKANDSINTLGKWNFKKIIKNISIYFSLIKLIRQHKPDLVLIPISQTTTGFIKDAFFILISKLFGKKILIQLRGSNFKNWITSSSNLMKWYVKYILKKTQGVIVLGYSLRHLFENYFTKEHIFVVPNGANYSIPEKTKSNELVNILYLSNLLTSKGIDDVFEAITILDKKNIACSFEFIGEWLHEETKKSCLNKIKDCKIPIDIHTSAESANKFQYLANADIFIFPPREPEGHPWSIIEAMAAGLPIISTNQGAIAESVIDGKNGFIVEPKNPALIAEKLQFLIENKSTRLEMGKASRELYLNNFTEEQMVANLTATFKHIIQHN